MKPQFFAAIVLTIIITELSNAQNLSIGPRFGANFSTIKGLSNNSTRTGWVAGGFLEFKPCNKIGFTTDLLLSTTGAHIKNYSGNESSSESWDSYINMVYFNVPVLMNLYLKSENSLFRPRIFAGPSISAQLSTQESVQYRKAEIDKDSTSSWNQTITSKFKKIDIGVIAGAGFDYKMSEKTFFSLDIRYIIGLTDLRKTSASYPNTLYNRNLSILFGIGYKIGS